uniref:Uncharacterized protein n=1 Tax=Nelumbo nucifera TaxID=4432 RepID=A0A822XT47_NELNU|nr:TPA_asm: hypothetical protein HUJ06_024346 [Nelumbo nucifera]
MLDALVAFEILKFFFQNILYEQELLISKKVILATCHILNDRSMYANMFLQQHETPLIMPKWLGYKYAIPVTLI